MKFFSEMDKVNLYFSGTQHILNSPSEMPEAERGERVQKLHKLYIEATSACNFSCPMCPRSFWDEKDYRHMDDGIFRAAVDSAAEMGTVKTVFFGGFGEPLCNPHLGEMIRYAAERGFRTELITNGKLLDEQRSCELLRAGIKSVWVSFEGVDPATSGHSSFGGNIVYENLQRFRTLRMDCRPDDFCELNLSCVIMRSNLAALGGIMDVARRLRAQNVMFTHIIPYDESCLHEMCYEMMINSGAGIKTESSVNTRVYLPFSDFRDPQLAGFLSSCLLSGDPLILGNTSVSRQHNRCPFIEDGDTFVRSDGEVCPCMALLHSGPLYEFGEKRHITARSFGNLADRSLQEIWESEEYTAFRRKVIDFSFSPCIDCGGCELRQKNEEDCIGNTETTCGACVWAAGIARCP